MNLKLAINIAQIIISIILVVAVLLQARGSGLGSAFGGDSMVFRTKRGVEKSLHIATIILVIVFLALSLTLIFI
ncbi:preprotein translocase subunit SecG [Patescibacteria group bacterium]|nr:preprotein translocase subunit SecG [Patescibacteria group bacterium]